MKPDLRNIDEIVKRYWPPAANEAMQSDVDRVRRRLESGTARSIDPVLAQPPRWRFAMVVALLLLSVMGIVVLRYFRAFVTVAVIETEEGSLFRVGDGKATPIQAGERVRPGETVRTNSLAGAQLLLVDGSRLEMRKASELLLDSVDDGVRIRLNTGSVIVNAAKQNGGHLYVQTKDVVVSVIGTVFFVNEEAEGSRVGVLEGEVRVQRGEATAKLLPGQHLETNPLMNPVSLQQAVSWSRHAESHVALLEQTAATPAPPPLRLESEQVSLPTQSATSLEFAAASIRLDTMPPIIGPLGATTGQVLCRGVNGLVGRQAAGAEENGYPTVAPLGRCVGRSVTLGSFIAAAFGARSVSGLPESFRTKAFQINAVSEFPATTTKEQLLEMLRILLVRTFNLKLRNETRESPGYALLVSANGLKLKETSKPEEPLVVRIGGQSASARGDGPVNPTAYRVFGIAPLSAFASTLGGCALGNVLVIDKTGLQGNFEFNFGLRPVGYSGGPCSPEFDPSLRNVLERELGLTLQTQNVPETAIVIEHAELPAEN